jgi:hypothetical protein
MRHRWGKGRAKAKVLLLRAKGKVLIGLLISHLLAALALLVHTTPLLEHMAPMQPCRCTPGDKAEADDHGGKVCVRQAPTRVYLNQFTDCQRQINLIIFCDLLVTLYYPFVSFCHVKSWDAQSP